MTLTINYNTDLEVRSDRTVIDRAFFNRRFKAVYDQLVAVDKRQATYDAQVATLVQLGLDRINDTLGPMLETVQEASELGFLVCRADGQAHSMVLGEAEGFVVTEGADLFAPTPFLMAQDPSDIDNWGILKLDAGGWTRETGDLATHCVYANKTKSSLSWVISACGAMLPAEQNLLTQSQTARNEAVAANASVSAQMATLQSAINAIQSGPVSSVAGKTGAVTLVEADIANLVTDLASKATISYVNTQTANKQDASAKLTTLVNLAWAANKILYSTSTSALSTLDVTDFIKTLLDDATAAAAQSTLGISAFIQTLLDDADAATARTTLGITSAAAATDAQVRSATGTGFIQASSLETAAATVTLTDLATIAVDWDAFINAQVTLTASGHVIGNPTNGQPGTTRTILVKGNSTTGRTFSFGSQYVTTNLDVEFTTGGTITSAQFALFTIFCVTTTQFVVTGLWVP